MPDVARQSPVLTRTAVTSTHFSLALHSVSAAHLRSPTNEALVPQAVRSKKTHFMSRLDTTRVCFALLSFAACTKPPPQPTPAPAAPVLVAPKAEEGPGPDEFAWLKDKGPKVEALLAAENAYTEAMLAPQQALRATLVEEINARRPQRIDSLGRRHGSWTWFERSDLAWSYPQVLRRPLDGGTEQLVLDLNAVAPDASYVNLLGFDVSDDEQRVAWAIDTQGSRDFTLRVRELDGGTDWPVSIPHVTSFTFAGDSRTLFFTTQNEATRSSKLFRFEGDAGVLVFEEPDEHFELSVSRSNGRSLVLLESESLTTSETRMLDAKTPRANWTLVAPRVDGLRYSVDEHGDELVLLTQDQGDEGRVVTVPKKKPSGSRKELVPRREGVPISAVDVLATHFVLWERRDGQLRPRAIDWKTRTSRDFAATEGVFSGRAQDGYDSTHYLYGVESPVQPYVIFDRDLVSGTTTSRWVTAVQHFDASQYEAVRTFATAKDGTKIPLTLARKKGLAPNAPLILEGYGAYGDPLEPFFSNASLSLLERGVVLGFAHVRGGGEYGDAWHEGGMLATKQNTFSDFIACAEFLIESHVTTPEKLVITGASAGGLLMGAVLNQRPELFHAALVEVPFVDVINTMSDASLPLTVGEFEEWGDPRQPDARGWMSAYSPYDNVKAQAYPSLLVRSAYNDKQVLFHEPTKWVQRLRKRKTDANPVLLWMSMDPAGHSGRASTADVTADDAKRLAWVLSQWGAAVKVTP